MNWLAVPSAVWTALPFTGGVLALVAGMLIARAVRGTPVGWQPVCRRCKHDLRGVDPSKGSCPECGADLTRAGAVRTGGRVRRAGAIVVAVVAVAVAGTTLRWLTPSQVSRWRTELVASMPFDALVDLVLSGTADKTDVQLAALAIDSRLGTRGGWQQQGATRSLPSGELLEAFLKAFARCDEPGRIPRAAVIEGAGRPYLANLDAAERERLIQLAADEILGSSGAKRELARCVVAIDQYRGDFELAGLDALESRLRSTEEGRTVILPKIASAGPTPTGGLIALDLKGPLDDLKRNASSGFEGNPDALLIEVAEAVRADAPDGAPAIVLRLMPESEKHSFREGLAPPSLLADLAPGSYRIRLRGVVAPQVLVPTRRNFGGASTASITPAEAAKLEGARTIEQTLTVDITPMPEPPEPLTRTTDAELVAQFTEQLKSCRITRNDMGSAIDFDAAPRRQVQGERALRYRFTLVARQDGKTHRFGKVSGAGNGRSMSGTGFPEAIVTSRPFEIVLDPAVSWVDSQQVVERGSDPELWARFILRFANATAAPEVVAEALPDAPVVVTPLVGDEARQLLQQSVIKASPGMAMRARGRVPERKTIDFVFGGIAEPTDGSGAGADLGPILLSGLFEVRSEGALLAPTALWFVTFNPKGASLFFPVADGTSGVFPRTLRCTPDPRVARAEVSASFRYFAEPFELRFTEPTKPPELVWLESAK